MSTPARQEDEPGSGPSNDALTGFGTRQSLLAALTRAVEPGGPPTLLVVFGLDGFAEYATLFGSLAARTLLARLGGRLARVLPPDGACYRPRHDEFAVLVPTTIAEAQPILDAATTALRHRGTPVAVAAAWGAAMLPEEASEPIAALRVADERLSSNAPRRRRRNRRSAAAGPRRQSSVR